MFLFLLLFGRNFLKNVISILFQELNFVDIINALSGMLKPDRSFEGIIPITTAKVPILKFKHKATRLEGDISLYNILVKGKFVLFNVCTFVLKTC